MLDQNLCLALGATARITMLICDALCLQMQGKPCEKEPACLM